MDYRIEQLRHQLRENPTSRHFYQLGELLRKEKQAEEAVKILEAGLEHHPRYVSAWVSLGRSHLELQQLDEAEEAFNKALSFDPENAVAARMIGRVATERGDWLSAVKKLKLARALSPRDETLDQEIAEAEAKLAAGEQVAVASAPEAMPSPEPEPVTEAGMELPPPVPEELPAPTEPEPMVAAEMELPPPVPEELPAPTEPEPMVAAEMELPPPVPEELPAPAEPEPMVAAEMELPAPAEPEPMADVGMEPHVPEELPLPSEPEVMVAAEMEIPPPVPEEAPEGEPEMIDEVMELPPEEGELLPQPEADAELAAYEIPEDTQEAELLEAEVEPGEEYSPWDDAPTVDLPDYPSDQSAEPTVEEYVQESEVAGAAATPEPEPAVPELPAEAGLAAPQEQAGDESQQAEEEDIRATSPIEIPQQLLSTAVERLPESELEADELAEGSQVEDLPVPTLTLARLAVEQSDFELAKRTLVKILDMEPNNLEAQQLLEMVRISIGEPAVERSVPDELAEEVAEGAELPAAPAAGSAESVVRALQRWLNSIKLAAERRAT